jgi:glycosyltransferase involved in cell wall biosynthesis
MPNAVLEAMSQGRPVIVSDAQTGLAGIVRDGETGLVVPVESVDALAKAMITLTANAELRRRFGEPGREAVAPFQPDRAIAAWTQALFHEG